jgi:stage V sporulation protein B
MPDRESKSKSIIVQGTILAAASFISRIVGLLYRVPLTRIIGKRGNDYYGTAYTIYSILLIISSYSLPLAVSKMVSERMAKGESKNAARVFKGSLVFACVSGGIASVILFVFADVFSGWVKTPEAALALRILAPVLFLTAIVGVLRGLFQGLHTMIPTAVSQIIEQIVNAIISVVAAYFLFTYGLRAGAVLGNANNGPAFGAAGGTLGTLAGSVAALVFMTFFTVMFIRFVKKNKRKDLSIKESYRDIFHIIILTVVPVILSTTLYNVSAVIEMFIFKNIAVFQKYPVKSISEWWGVYSGEYLVLQGVPMSIASSLASSSVPSLSASYALGKKEDVRSKIRSVSKFIMIIAIPCSVGLMVLSGPILKLMFHDPDKLSALILIIGSFSIPFYCLSTLSNGFMQGINKMKVPLRNCAIAMAAHAIMLVILMLVFRANIIGVVIANNFYSIVLAIMNDISIRRYSKANLDPYDTFLKPLASSIVMGFFVFIVYKILDVAIGINLFGVIVGIFTGILVYFVMIIKTGTISKDELITFPGGHKLYSLAKRMRLL